MRLLIDGDEIAYKATSPKTIWMSGLKTFTSKKQAITVVTDSDLNKTILNPMFSSAQTQINNMVTSIRQAVADQFFIPDVKDIETILVVSGKGNFRKTKYPSYKSNRDGRERPFYLQQAKDYIVKKYKGIVSTNEEADDVLGYMKQEDDVVASSDKDLKTIPGWTYDIMHKSFHNISLWEADLNFYTQMLTGDRADGVEGLKGIGPVRAYKLLKECENDCEMLKTVIKEYGKKDLGIEDVMKNGDLLYIRRLPEEIWSEGRN